MVKDLGRQCDRLFGLLSKVNFRKGKQHQQACSMPKPQTIDCIIPDHSE